MTLPLSIVDSLVRAEVDPADVLRVVTTALDEDLGPAHLDVTSVATIGAGQRDTADLVARADGVVAGLAVAATVFEVVSNGPAQGGTAGEFEIRGTRIDNGTARGEATPAERERRPALPRSRSAMTDESVVGDRQPSGE
jgi:hypothetical protein